MDAFMQPSGLLEVSCMHHRERQILAPGTFMTAVMQRGSHTGKTPDEQLRGFYSGAKRGRADSTHTQPWSYTLHQE